MSTVWSAKLIKVSLVLLPKHTETITGNMYSYIHKWLDPTWCDFATTNTCYSCPFCHSQYSSQDAATLHMVTDCAVCSHCVVENVVQSYCGAIFNGTMSLSGTTFPRMHDNVANDWSIHLLMGTKCQSPTKRFSYKIIENTFKMRWYVCVCGEQVFIQNFVI